MLDATVSRWYGAGMTNRPILHHVEQEGTWLGYVWALSWDDGTEIFRGTYKKNHLDRDGYGDCQRHALDNYRGYRNIPTWSAGQPLPEWAS